MGPLPEPLRKEVRIEPGVPIAAEICATARRPSLRIARLHLHLPLTRISDLLLKLVRRNHRRMAGGRRRRKRDGLRVRHASQGENRVHLMLAVLPWHQPRDPAGNIPEDYNHDYELGGFSYQAAFLRSSIQYRIDSRAAVATGTQPAGRAPPCGFEISSPRT